MTNAERLEVNTAITKLEEVNKKIELYNQQTGFEDETYENSLDLEQKELLQFLTTQALGSNVLLWGRK